MQKPINVSTNGNILLLLYAFIALFGGGKPTKTKCGTPLSFLG